MSGALWFGCIILIKGYFSSPSLCVAIMNLYRDGECIAPYVCFNEMTGIVYKRK